MAEVTSEMKPKTFYSGTQNYIFFMIFQDEKEKPQQTTPEQPDGDWTMVSPRSGSPANDAMEVQAPAPSTAPPAEPAQPAAKPADQQKPAGAASNGNLYPPIADMVTPPEASHPSKCIYVLLNYNLFSMNRFIH